VNRHDVYSIDAKNTPFRSVILFPKLQGARNAHVCPGEKRESHLVLR
jgi:hypothetical protein